MACRMNPDTDSHPPLRSPARDEGLRCLSCNYNLTGLPSGLCPECGRAFDVDELRRELTGGVPRPVPIWDEPQRFGRAEAFVRTALCGWFEPASFAKRFPARCRPWRPAAFCLCCHLIAYLLAGSVVGTIYLISRSTDLAERMVPFFRAMPFLALEALLCQVLIAGVPFWLAAASPGPRYSFRASWHLLQFTNANLILSWASASLLMGEIAYMWGPAWYTFGMLGLFGFSFLLWWFDLIIMLVTLGRRPLGTILGVFLVSAIAIAAVLPVHIAAVIVMMWGVRF